MDDQHKESLTADVVLTAAGNVEELGLEATAVKTDRSHIVTDAYGATGEPGVYAIGNVAGAPWLAHKASHEAVICVDSCMYLQPSASGQRRVDRGTGQGRRA